MNWKIDEERILERLKSALLTVEAGKVTKSLGLIYEAYLPGASVGSLCKIYPAGQKGGLAGGIDAEVIGFRDERILLMPFDDAKGINNESLVVLKRVTATATVSDSFLGRVFDGRGVPIDGKGPIIDSGTAEDRKLYEKPSDPLQRKMIVKPLDLGIRSINGLITVGKGQRMGIMAGSGVGKSVLLGMMARNTSADVNVIALVGERGREVREFVERDLGVEGLKRSVVIVATSDSSPLQRMRAAFLACAVAEYFRDQGKDVLMMMDSVTRFAMAQREIGLALGEPPATKGYTPSVFATLPKILERAGTTSGDGSITGLYTVLVEGDDLDDPIADSARSYLDGHIVLSRRLAERNHFPAVDVLKSTSRVMSSIVDQQHRSWAAQVREWMATFGEVEDLLNIGAYVKGANPRIDQAIAVREKIEKFCRQSVDDRSLFADCLGQLHSISRAGEAYLAAVPDVSNSRQTVGKNPLRF